MLLKVTGLLILTISTTMADVAPPKDQSENFCLNKQTIVDNENLARKHPDDPIMIKLVALRSGLCDLLSKGIIDLDFAIDLFQKEKYDQIMRKFEEEQRNLDSDKISI